MNKRLIAVLSIALVAAVAAAPAAQAKKHPKPKPAQSKSGIAQLQQTPGPAAYFRNIEVAPEVGMTQHPGPLPVTAGLERIWDLGVAWKDVNPSQGVFDFTQLDAQVNAAKAAGFKPMLVLGLTPKWAAADPTAGDPRWGLGTSSAPAQMSYWTDYVSAVANRYKTDIGAYEVWNEANLKTFWTGTPAEMAQMTQAAYPIIKASNPNAIVLAASVTTRLHHAMANFVTPYVQALANIGYPYDGYAIHTYPAGDQGPSARVSDILYWESVVVGALPSNSTGLKKLIYDTEVNYGVAGPGDIPGHKYTDAEGADLIKQTYADSKGLGIDGTSWYLYTAAPFSLLGVQLYAGTPLSIAAFNSAS